MSARLDYKFVLLVALLALFSLLMIFVGNGNPVVALLPVGGFLLVYALVKSPLRVPTLGLLLIGITVDNPVEPMAAGLYESPLAPLGRLFLAQLKHMIPIDALVLTGVDTTILLLTAIYVVRRALGSSIDKQGFVSTPRPLLWASFACIAAAFLTWGFGMARGGELRFTLWQVRNLVSLPLFFLFFQAAFPSPGVYRTLGRVFLTVASLKAAAAIYLLRLYPDAAYQTSHDDSMLFALATCILVVALVEERSRRTWIAFLTLVPLLVFGMVANNRRIVWVEVGEALTVLYLISPWTKRKIKVTRRILVCLPVIALYCGAGWGSGSAVFRPVATLRSMVDSKGDGSSLWRDLENFNLVATLQTNPVLGSGLGHAYELAVPIPDITSFYELEPYAPHNSVLGIWAFTGYLGFTLTWMPIVVSVYFAARAYRLAASAPDRTAALCALLTFVIYGAHCYGDLGLGCYMSLFLVACAMVVAGKLAVAVGAWPGVGGPAATQAPTPVSTHPEPVVQQRRPLALPGGFQS